MKQITVKKPIQIIETIDITVDLPAYFMVNDLSNFFYHCISDSQKSSYCANLDFDISLMGTTTKVNKVVEDGVQITREEFEAQFERAMKTIVNAIPKA